MIADCAVDPEVFARWQHFQSLSEDFGVSRGRLISEFPGKWRRQVLKHAEALGQTGENSPLQNTKIVERMMQPAFKRKLRKSGGRVYVNENSWRDNALDANPPFDAIIAAGSDHTGNLVGAEDLCKDESPFARPQQVSIPRQAKEIIRAAEVLLADCKELVLVDPNFRANEPRFGNTLTLLMEKLEQRGGTLQRFELHTQMVRNANEGFHRGPQMSQWMNHVVPHLPTGWKFDVCYWQFLPDGGRLHARFLLTEKGGISYDHGLDEGEGETLVTLLEDSIWEKVFRTFDTGALPEGFDRETHVLRFP